MNENIKFIPPIFHKIRILEKMPLNLNLSSYIYNDLEQIRKINILLLFNLDYIWSNW